MQDLEEYPGAGRPILKTSEKQDVFNSSRRFWPGRTIKEMMEKDIYYFAAV